MLIGKLNKRITLQSKTTTRDAMGGMVETWTDVATIWAAVWPTSAKTKIQAESTTMIATHRIRIRYRTSIDSTYRVKFKTRYFSIDSITNPNEHNEWLDLICREVGE